MIWFEREPWMDSDTMRQIAKDAGVSWDYQAISYAGGAVGFVNGNSADVGAIKNAADKQLVETENPIDE